ncbi:type IV pilus biogenesis protein PilP [Desulfovibrio sp. JC010]|uniref:type IV pilus biogenesis protein PilP n=1 Tax=Desulfovibrio sp. JC010 TaxID=2593641 RepID=UPI0013D1F680|nr:type IV pilus biogenesis protein PilP [Desulfovibrio sp. JC010]NDV28946.1 type IV pilus biogenesis protein PilP [Desulfovibrio sp. JC010]
MRLINLVLIMLLLATAVYAQESADMASFADPLVSAPANSSMPVGNGTAFNATAAGHDNGTNATIPTFYEATNSTSNGTTTQPNSAEKQTSARPKISGPAFVSLEGLSALHSQLDVLNVQVKIAEKQKKLRELTMPIIPVLPPASAAPKTAVKKTSRPVWPKIVSIQGVDGRLSATLVSRDGVQTVSEGASVGIGRVDVITPQSVLVRHNGKNIPLKFVE